MANRFQTKRTGPLKKRHVFLIVLILVTLISVQGFLYVERNLEPALKEIAKTYVKRMATLAITDAISQKINDDVSDSTNLAIIEKDGENRIQLISIDHSRQARVVTQVTERANQTLMELSKEPFEIPLGQALNSNILAQFGPMVPIALFPMGAAKADIDVRMKQAGINVVSIEVYLIIEANVHIVIPFSTDEDVVTTEFPIEVHILPGEVPNYYFKNEDGSVSPVPSVSVPGS